ncbi:MAG: hypothetical protein Q7S14_01050 [bacterium]|nr:hypothetical protein [bacterium]
MKNKVKQVKKRTSTNGDWKFFRKLAKKYGDFDYGKALRQERDR